MRLKGKHRAALTQRKFTRTAADASATTFLLAGVSLTSPYLQWTSASRPLAACLASRESPSMMAASNSKELFQGILLKLPPQK